MLIHSIAVCISVCYPRSLFRKGTLYSSNEPESERTVDGLWELYRQNWKRKLERLLTTLFFFFKKHTTSECYFLQQNPTPLYNYWCACDVFLASKQDVSETGKRTNMNQTTRYSLDKTCFSQVGNKEFDQMEWGIWEFPIDWPWWMTLFWPSQWHTFSCHQCNLL